MATCKNIRDNTIAHRFLHANQFHTKRKMEQMLQTYGLPKEAIIILYKNRKAMVRSPDGDTDFFDIVTGILQADTLTTYFFFYIYQDYVLQSSIDLIKKNGFT